MPNPENPDARVSVFDREPRVLRYEDTANYRDLRELTRGELGRGLEVFLGDHPGDDTQEQTKKAVEFLEATVAKLRIALERLG